MSFEHPMLLLALPLALLFSMGAWLLRHRRALDMLRLALPQELLDRAADWSWRVSLLWLPSALVMSAIAASVFAAAGPYNRAEHVTDRRGARDIALVLDTSESMRGMDLQLGGVAVSRMEAALRFAGDFIKSREGDRIAVEAFGSRAITQCPLTFDREVAGTLLGYVEAEMLGKRTALGEGIALGVARLPAGGALVLLSDGQNTAGEVGPLEAAHAAVARGVKVHAIGVGSTGPVPIPSRLPSGRLRMEQKDYALDEATLQQVALTTGGRYFRATDADLLQKAFSEIDRLEKHELPVTRAVPGGRLGDCAALLALAALACASVTSPTVLRAAPRLR